MNQWKRECNEFIDNHIEGKEILDIGCGAYPHPKATVTLDALDEISIRGRTFRPDIVADINQKIPLPDNSVDCIIMNNVLEHLHNPRRAIDECHRILKKDGLLLVAVPFLIKLHQEPVDFHRYTEYMLKRMFKDFSYAISPSTCTLKDFYKTVQNDLFGEIGRKNLIGFLVSKLAKYLTIFIPDISERSYPTGYLISARKH